jgi:hypothetical protein
METPESVLSEYVHNLPTTVHAGVETETYIDEAVARHGVSAMIAEVTRATGSLDPAVAHGAWLFIRDASIQGLSAREVSDRFRRELPDSGLFDALERCLHAPVFALRSGAVYTFGKMGFPENAARLARAFEARRDLDPFLMPGLLFETRWLEAGGGTHWERVRELTGSSGELSRWCSLHLLREARDERIATALDLARSLQRDPSAFVQAEAVHVVARLADAARRDRRGCTGKEEAAHGRAFEAQEQQRIAALAPEVTFEEVMHRFTLAATEPDYTLEDVLAFLQPLRS